MKKFLSILMGVTLTVGLVGFSACGEEAETPDPVHGFEGTFSEESYENEQDAVQALEGEFSGDVYKIDIKKYSHESSISKKTIKNLNTDRLDEDDKVVSGKKVKVTYTSTAEKTSSGASSAEEEETSFSAKVFETKENGDKRFRYYIDRADYDGMISKSYFVYLISANPGENFTQTNSTSISIEMMGEKRTESEAVTVKCDGDKAIVQVGEESAYLENEDGEIKVWKKTAKGYEKVTDLTLAGVDLGKYFEDGAENEELDGFDQTCFIPSETGIVINEGGKGVFLKKLEEELGEAMDSSSLFSLDGELTFDIQTKEGVPMKIEIKATVFASILGFTMNEVVESKFEVTDVGTTVVETPEGIK